MSFARSLLVIIIIIIIIIIACVCVSIILWCLIPGSSLKVFLDVNWSPSPIFLILQVYSCVQSCILDGGPWLVVPVAPNTGGIVCIPADICWGGSGCCNLWSACQAEVDGLFSGSKGTGWLLRVENLMRLQVGRRSILSDELWC